MLHAIETILAAGSVERLWQYYQARMTEWGFPHAAYYGVRLLYTGDEPLADDSIFLSSYPSRLLYELMSLDLFNSVPMYRWIIRHKGSKSWDWVEAQRQAGRLTGNELRALDLFARYGYVAGFAISLIDEAHRVRAGVIFSGEVGMRQEKLNELWQQHHDEIEALTGLVHLRLASLPYVPPGEILTARQREALEYISVGRTTQEIAEILDVTLSTVEKHLRLARKALGARTTAQAVLLAANRRQMFIDSGHIVPLDRGGSAHDRDDAASRLWARARFLQSSDYLYEYPGVSGQG